MQQTDKFISLHHSLMDLGHSDGFVNHSYEQKLKKILKSCAHQLKVERVSLWSFNHNQTEIYCELLYRLNPNLFESGLVLEQPKFPRYFKAIIEDRLINANYAPTDPATAEFADVYLAGLGITSMLDVPIFSSGDRYGVLCIEHVGEPREWDLAEMSYATAVADKIALINEHESWLRARESVDFLQHNDLLTGLENRTSFHQRIDRTLHAQAGNISPCALIIAGIDDFTGINDHWGHQQANEVLIRLADRFEKASKNKEYKISRLGGDNFGFWLPHILFEEQIDECISCLKDKILKPVKTLKNNLIQVSASFGVVIFPLASTSIHDPIRCAEIAMLRAKSKGRGSIEFFSVDWISEYQAKRSFEKELETAISEEQLCPYYQPIVDSHTHQCIGIEALVRWKHPTRGVLTPYHFLSTANELGKISELGDIMLRKVCQHLAIIRQHGISLNWASVNLAAEQLYDTSLVSFLTRLLEQHKLPGSMIELEIVEELISLDSEIVTKQIGALAELGVRLAIDDFGTGYSSLSRLKHLPVSKLKIDKSFVDGLMEGDDDQCIANSIIGLGAGLNLDIVAEGVENIDQAQWLSNAGCTYLQGYYFAKPMPFEELLTVIEQPRLLSEFE